MTSHAIIVTSIAPPTATMRVLAEGARARGRPLICVANEKSPDHYALDGVEFLSLARQMESGYRLAVSLPTGHYSRKNLGYLRAIERGAVCLSETDDDNAPLPAFWHDREPEVAGRLLSRVGWHNPYRYEGLAARAPPGGGA